ncbi:nitroreductase family protein [bacterium]|nr:nitroreductase family protein [bacterium]
MNFRNWCLTLAMTAFMASACSAGDTVVSLPAPVRSGGQGIMTVLNERHTERNFLPDPLPRQELSNLLWAAYGVNRKDGKRTVPTAMNKRNMDVYVADASGLWLYDPENNTLILKKKGDARAGRFKEAPLMFYYAAPKGDRFAGMHAGSMYQSAALYCASVGLGNVVCYQSVGEVNNLFDFGEKEIVVSQVFGRAKKAQP